MCHAHRFTSLLITPPGHSHLHGNVVLSRRLLRHTRPSGGLADNHARTNTYRNGRSSRGHSEQRSAASESRPQAALTDGGARGRGTLIPIEFVQITIPYAQCQTIWIRRYRVDTVWICMGLHQRTSLGIGPRQGPKRLIPMLLIHGKIHNCDDYSISYTLGTGKSVSRDRRPECQASPVSWIGSIVMLRLCLLPPTCPWRVVHTGAIETTRVCIEAVCGWACPQSGSRIHPLTPVDFVADYEEDANASGGPWPPKGFSGRAGAVGMDRIEARRTPIHSSKGATGPWEKPA